MLRFYDAVLYLFSAFLDEVRGEVRQLLEGGVFAPHGLGHHLGQLHGRQGRREPTIAAQYVHTGLDQTDSLLARTTAIIIIILHLIRCIHMCHLNPTLTIFILV